MNAFKHRGLILIGLALAALLMMIIVSPLQTQAAGEAKERGQFNVGITLADNLTALKGKTVTVTLIPGQTITGIVKDVKDNLLHLEKISQKEFYDAIIRIDHISAVEARIR